MLLAFSILDRLYQAWAFITQGRVLAIAGGVGFALLAIFLLIASRTRWGHSKLVTKCVVLSVLAHIWLLMYALGTRAVLPQGERRGGESALVMDFTLLEDSSTQLAVPGLPDPSSMQDDSVLKDAQQFSNQHAIDSTNLLPAWEQPIPLSDLPMPVSPLLSVSPSPSLQQSLKSGEIPWEAPPELLAEVTPTPLPSLPEELLATASNRSDNDAIIAASPTGITPESHSGDTPPSVNASQLADEQSPTLERSVLPVARADDTETSTKAPTSPSLANNPNLVPRAVSPTDVSPTDVSPTAPTAGAVSPTASTWDASDNRQAATLAKEYQMRSASNRLELARPFGADEDSEAAVDSALRWLARSQSDDGSWNAALYGGGTETRALGEFRHNTGSRADTGVSGLALLAFLSAGHTHLSGEHRRTVERGLAYLLQTQMPSGDLSGPKQIGNEPGVVNARMYCHSIAMLALAEAHAMTHDPVIREGLTKAASYTVAAQDKIGGGWRYKPGDPGDLSLFGWKALALKSIARSGIEIPVEVERRMRRFLDSCAAGRGGLARYRPAEGRPSETMTAEALACRMLLDYPLTSEARSEAHQMILRNLPGSQPDNVYFWYYATLALFQSQDENWRVWNQALKSRLLKTQYPAYSSEAGSWDPDPVWGGYGGRVYSTAMSCLCLEVYYRYLPLYQRAPNMARSPNPNQW